MWSVRDATNNMSDLISTEINNLYTHTPTGKGFVSVVPGSTTWQITHLTRVKIVRCKVPISFLHGGDPIRNDSWKWRFLLIFNRIFLWLDRPNTGCDVVDLLWFKQNDCHGMGTRFSVVFYFNFYRSFLGIQDYFFNQSAWISWSFGGFLSKSSRMLAVLIYFPTHYN